MLFVAIDDINDWVGPLGGHPQAKTPNLDKFCEGGAMIFKNAVCAAPICGPSRSAILSGFMPNRTGVYGNGSNMIYSDLVKTHATLPEYFSKHGYYTLSNGKIFHKHGAEFGTDFGHWAFDEHARARRYVKNAPDKNKVTSGNGTINGVKKPEYNGKAKLSWGPTKCGFEEMVDYKVADWGREQLNRDYDQPFFMALGIIKPHLPWNVPQEFFDLYDLETIQVPEVKADDLDDILTPAGKREHQPSKEYEWIKKHGLEKEATRAYLANISFADACLGVIFDALEKSSHADDTVVFIWGDHGWHLGEKQRYLKNTLWSETAKTPFLVRMPGMKSAVYSDRTVSLIDMYPTLVKLCGLPEKELDGHDFSALLANPNAEWDYPGVTVSTGGTSVMGERWHYISNLSGAEELYDLSKDPMEWTNLANNPEHAELIAEMKKWVPKERTAAKKIHFDKQPNYVDADADPSIKPTRDLNKLK
ncbi:sulfatase [Pontiella sulfatireligans]|uniref:Choline-sulfatase n=1 Tax=Pontiella sulfatireligans TaxID=2750658 RepID=A0A6C2UM06_9BACT|nr:sulfatase [Pontiella sulfatireligans]SPS74400.1 sulfatase S1_7 [Kiritimatiellales bacterium]VGO20381.1 Choline-sulfatase [Pontiella sulfatireligans]